MLKRIFLVSVVMAVSAVAETKATVVNYNSEWISWVKRINLLPLPPNFKPQVQVFFKTTESDIVAIRVTLKSRDRVESFVFPVTAGGGFGLINDEWDWLDSASVELLVSRGQIQIPIEQRRL